MGSEGVEETGGAEEVTSKEDAQTRGEEVAGEVDIETGGVEEEIEIEGNIETGGVESVEIELGEDLDVESEGETEEEDDGDGEIDVIEEGE